MTRSQPAIEPMNAKMQPLVSCIMPTHNRRRFVPQAFHYFFRQDYPNKELIILDDGTDPVDDLVPEDPRIRYLRLDKKHILGTKRNLACEHAHGDIIAHWDDDDWIAPHRLSYQVEQLLRQEAEVCGIDRIFYFDPNNSRAWQYVYPAGSKPWVAGGTLCYTKASWKANPFRAINVGEDNQFVWARPARHLAILPDDTFYVALIHPRNSSRKHTQSKRWQPRQVDAIRTLLGEDRAFYEGLGQAPDPQASRSASVTVEKHGAPPAAGGAPSPTYSIVMVAHNALPMVQMATLRTLRHSAAHDARLIVVDNASTDGTQTWLKLLADRGDIDLIRSETNLGHGPALERARRHTQSPYLVTLDSDAFPVADDWLPRLRERLTGSVKVAGIRHHRDYIHPSCLMIERETLEAMGLHFLNEKDKPSKLDVAERLSCAIKGRGFEIAGLERTGEQRRGSRAEPVYLGSVYDDLVYHQWYTTRKVLAGRRQVDDVPSEAIEQSLREVFEAYHAEPREATVVLGLRATPNDADRLRNALVVLRALNHQDLPRWRYRVVVVEQDREPRLEQTLAPLADRYFFAYNPGPYNRSWAFNIGAIQAAHGHGALCLIDADLLVPSDFLRKGLAAFEAGHRAVLPYTEVVYLEEASTKQAIRDQEADPRRWQKNRYRGKGSTWSQGGCIWVDAALYRDVGGHDERFRGWGCEDREFYDRLARHAHIEHLPGRLLHLYHRRPSETDQWASANRRLTKQIAQGISAAPSSNIGDLGLYRSEAPSSGGRAPVAGRAAPPALGRREGEHWYRWKPSRIENIVRQEQRNPNGSTRCELASILVTLGRRMLDVGCGPGALWTHLRPHRPHFSWTGADVTPEMLAVAKRFFPEVPVVHAEVKALPFDEQAFDLVLLRHVLEHVQPASMPAVLQEAFRVAKSAVVVVFYVLPTDDGATKTEMVGGGFWETQWAASDIKTAADEMGWTLNRQWLGSNGVETNEVWIWRSPEHATEQRARQGAVAFEPFKFSIIMPTYRRRHTIFRTIENIKAQSYQNWELIIVDNAGDGGYHFDDPRIRVYRHTRRASASYARNKGLQYATGDLVCFFDDDDDMFPSYLDRLAGAFHTHPDAKMVRCGMYVSDGTVNYTYATPEVCLRRPFATASWKGGKPGQDQRYFRQIVTRNRWSEQEGDIVVIEEPLCRANADPQGGLRSGKL